MLSTMFRHENLSDYQMTYGKSDFDPFIAEIYNSAEVWITHTEYRILERNRNGRFFNT